MSIDSLGSLSSKWGGGIVLHLLNVTRTDFRNLWLVILIRNVLRLGTLSLIFLIPKADQMDISNAKKVPSMPRGHSRVLNTIIGIHLTLLTIRHTHSSEITKKESGIPRTRFHLRMNMMSSIPDSPYRSWAAKIRFLNG